MGLSGNRSNSHFKARHGPRSIAELPRELGMAPTTAMCLRSVYIEVYYRRPDVGVARLDKTQQLVCNDDSEQQPKVGSEHVAHHSMHTHEDASVA